MSPNRANGPLGWGSYERLPRDRTLIMGILNVPPDSFSDGGTHDTADAAIAHGLELAAQGAVGPGAQERVFDVARKYACPVQ